MSLSPLANASTFLITTLFDFYIFILAIRLILVAVYADYFNPVSQFVNRCTQCIVTPLRRVIPNYKKIELATVVLIIFFEIIKFFLLSLLFIGMPNLIGLAILAIADALMLLFHIYFYSILLQAILSWIPQIPYTPITILLTKITTPIMRPFQRIIPPIGGLDLSPLAALLVIQLIIILFITPLLDMGRMMMS